MLERNREMAAQALAEALLGYLDCMTESTSNGIPEKKLYSVSELAELFGKAKDTVRRWIAEGEFGDPVHIGKSIFVTAAGIDKYLTDHTGPIQKREPSRRLRKARILNGLDPEAYKI